jgi:hypothetical protein
MFVRRLIGRPLTTLGVLAITLPVLALVDLTNTLRTLFTPKPQHAVVAIDENEFPSEKELHRLLNRIGEAGIRSTGCEAHNNLIAWIEQELRLLPDIELESDEFEILRWQTCNGQTLKDAARLTVANGDEILEVNVAGAVPFSKITEGEAGPLFYVEPGITIREANVKGKVILRDFPMSSIPYASIFLPSYYRTADLNTDLFETYDRPGLADMVLRDELIAAGEAGAVGMIIMIDAVRQQIESYFEPHQGVHYQLPAHYVGSEEAAMLKQHAIHGSTATLRIAAEISVAKTRNLHATLHGQTEERVIFETHTDGNTYIQENGPAALLALAQYYTNLPLGRRRRTIEFAFNTGHLHISHEGTYRHATQLDENFEHDKLTLIIPMEHLGSREIEASPRSHGQGASTLSYSGRGEMMFWCVGPSPKVVQAVESIVERRRLDRVLVTRGACMPKLRQVPRFSSFGGVGTYYHNRLLPTTSLISGPWSLWAPSFGKEAVDVARLRLQTLALGDVYLALQDVSRDEIVEGYRVYRQQRAKGAEVPESLIPPEVLQVV